jgi:ectoine hydroxylase-related dioxygenase (phytanoyl-CoA dioxygenase family)
MSRSPTIRESFFADPLYQSIVDHFLTLETTHWYDENPITTKSEPLLSIAITFDIPPGTKKQGLHRDDKNHHWRRNGRISKYEKGREGMLGLFVAGCDTTQQNGATRVVLGSHLWGDEKPKLAEMEKHLVDAEMKKGEALIMLGGVYHGGGEYEQVVEGKGESRSVHAMFCCNGVSRQEEVSFLVYDKDEVRTWSRVVRDRLGWKWSEPNLGWVDLKSPEFLLNLDQNGAKQT